MPASYILHSDIFEILMYQISEDKQIQTYSARNIYYVMSFTLVELVQ